MPSVFTLSGSKPKPKRRESGRRLDTTLPKPTRAQVKQMLGPFATSAQIDRHVQRYGPQAGLGFTRDKKVCPRVPSKSIEWTKIPEGTKVIDCGNLYVAKLKGGAAVAAWSSYDAIRAQLALRRLAARSAK